MILRRRAGAAWLVLAACLAAAPFAQGFTGGRIFYIRDLSLFFWGRFLWLRHTILSGEWPWWDPYVGAGQAAYADALHQMFLLPVLLLRLIGSEVLAFNLWVALPFPLAAAGTWFFLSRRFSAPAAALGAAAYALAGPITSTGNFPNMSWSVAALPWVLWAIDRVAGQPTPRAVAVLALTVALQALAGEPVTLFSTLAVGTAFALVVPGLAAEPLIARARRLAWVSGGITPGVLAAAVQLLPMARAAALADRSGTIGKDLWSLHPLALIETVSHHLFGDYYLSQSLVDVPWMPPLNSGREPFFFSIYFGVPLLSLALFGIVAGGPRRWSTFWSAAGAAALIGAFGVYTPIYPFLRDHLPVLSSFRFPVKYLVVMGMAVAAGAAAGWDALAGTREGLSPVRVGRARTSATAAALFVGAAAYAIAGLCLVATTPVAFKLLAIARMIEAADPIAAAEYMVRALPRMSTALMLVSVSTAGLVFLGAGPRRERALARPLLYAFVVGDLLLRAWGINPAFDPAHLARPQWLALTREDPDARFYVGGKRDGTLDPGDADSSRLFLNPPGLRGSASRAALSTQSAFYPSAWQAREMLSYDLAVLWPKTFQSMEERFYTAGPAARTRFLERAGVRYRILTERAAEGRTPLTGIPYFRESFLFDWGSDAVAPRASVVSGHQIVADTSRQIDALFEAGWDSRTTVLVDRDAAAEGTPAAPVTPFATLVADTPNAITIDAGAGAGGGHLVVLDSFHEDWRVTVDDRPAALLRANGLFRAVRLAPGRHRVRFDYRPRDLRIGAGVSAAALLVMIGCALLPVRRRAAVAQRDPVHRVAAL
jgi:hypothetical protein